MTEQIIKKMAVAIRHNKFERNGKGHIFDSTMISENEINEASAAFNVVNEEITRLRDALKVFADCAEQFDGCQDVRRYPDEEWAKVRLLVSDFRKAREALK